MKNEEQQNRMLLGVNFEEKSITLILVATLNGEKFCIIYISGWRNILILLSYYLICIEYKYCDLNGIRTKRTIVSKKKTNS